MRRPPRLAALGLLLGAVGVAAGWTVAIDRAYHGRVLPGVQVEGLDVGGLSASELVARIEAMAQARLQRSLWLDAVTPIAALPAQALGLGVEINRTIRAAMAAGREGGPVRRAWTRVAMRLRPIRLPVVYRYDVHAARAAVHAATGALLVEPRDAQVAVVRGRLVVVSPSRDGVVVDEAASAIRVIAALVSGQPRVALAVQSRRPGLTTEVAARMAEPVARFTTWFPPSPDRVHNIRLAASALRGLLLPPGAVLSYNAVVGPRNPKVGYRKAPVLINNELVPGDGGGVCQVSSTLFNAAVLAEMAVERRTNHSRPVPYLAAGRDATVEYGSIDLRLRNTTGSHLYLWTEVGPTSVTVTIFGPRLPGREVTIAVTDQVVLPAPTHTVVRHDPQLPAGQMRVEPPRTGLRSRTVRVVRQDGVVVRREVVALNYYQPVPQTVVVGTGAAPRQVSDRRAVP
ncbi:MAG: VanW family protein [Armatimonadota bacterium]|nr:VanW family protein [Armatimonadota bacterium]